ncbi:MAG: PKD domain-containing protein [Cyclobacteriaceae bacterium]
MKEMKKYGKQIMLFSALVSMVTFMSCDDLGDAVDEVTEDPIASFQFEVDSENFLMVKFENNSLNATSYSWDFGDGMMSEEEEPVHTYEMAGDYSVTLTASNDGGVQATKTTSISITDPLASQRTLIGESGKTWQLLGDPSTGLHTFLVGPDDMSQVWWSFGQVEELCVRECILDDTWTFNTDGTFTYDNNGDFWAEGGIWETPECFDATDAANWVGKDGQDLSGWNSGTHPFTFDPSTSKLVINGGFIGLTKAATDNDAITAPEASVTYTVVKLVDADVDTLVLETDLREAGGFWRFTLVSYDNPGDAIVVEECPAVEEVNVTFKVDMSDHTGSFTTMYVSGSFNGWSGDANPMTDMGSGQWELTIPIAVGAHEYKFQYDNWTDGGEGFGDGTGFEACVGSSDNTNWNRLLTVGETDMTVGPFCYNSCDVCGGTPAPATLGHTFADAAGADYFTKIDNGASVITLGADDPAGGADKVGKFDRIATAWQEAILTADTQSNFLLSNVTTMSIDVYLPSSNDYTGTLTKGMVIGFGDQTEGGDWWTYQAQWSADDLALDTWQTLTFDLKVPTSGNTADATQRTDLDMLFLGFGGGGHDVAGTFYIRNLSIK